MEVNPADYRIDRGAAWLERACDELRYGQGHVRVPQPDIRLAIRVLRMLETDLAFGPTIHSDRFRGIVLEWIYLDGKFEAVRDVVLQVKQGQASFTRHINSRPVPIAGAMRRKGMAETLRELLKWLCGPEIIAHEAVAVAGEITQGETGD